MVKDNGGSAFPCAAFGPNPKDEIYQYGMNLREWYAGQAIIGILIGREKALLEAHKTGYDAYKIAAYEAYEIADAMLEAREK